MDEEEIVDQVEKLWMKSVLDSLSCDHDLSIHKVCTKCKKHITNILMDNSLFDRNILGKRRYWIN